MYGVSERVGRAPAVQIAGCVTAALLFCWAGPARAEPTADEKALATVLFQEGRTLMVEGRIAEACAKLEESQRLDPSGGTLLNLALCHEQEGRLARAWSEFNDALFLARGIGRRDREIAASEHVGALTPRLSKLTVIVPTAAEMEGLKIERDGRELGRGAWATAMPVDGGEHVVRATAPGKQPFATTVFIAKESDAKTVEIPVLADAPLVAAPPPPEASAAPRLPPAPVVPQESDPGLRRTLAYVIGGAGLVQLGLAGYFGWRAFDKDRQYDGCVGSCAEPLAEGTTAANASTVLTITGIITVATGVYLLVTSRHKAAAPVDSKLVMGVSGRGMTVGGRF